MGFCIGIKGVFIVVAIAGTILSFKFFNSIRYAIDKKTHADYVHSLQNKEKQLEKNYKNP